MLGDCAYCSVIDTHLCDSCQLKYPECECNDVKFGCDIDTEPKTRERYDNIFYCDRYLKKEREED